MIEAPKWNAGKSLIHVEVEHFHASLHKITDKLQSFLYTSGNIKTTKDSTDIHKAVNNKSKIHQWSLNLHGGAI